MSGYGKAAEKKPAKKKNASKKRKRYPCKICGERHKKAYDAKKQIVCPGGGYPRKSGYQKKMTAKNYQERAQKEALAKEGKGESWPGFEVHNAVVQVELDQKNKLEYCNPFFKKDNSHQGEDKEDDGDKKMPAKKNPKDSE